MARGINCSAVFIYCLCTIAFNLNLIPFTHSQIVSVGKCPEKSINQTIALRKLAGTWYEIERSAILMQFPLKCVNVFLQQFFDGEATARLNSINRFTKAKVRMNGTARVLPNVRSTGRFAAVIPEFPKYTAQILATDFDNYGIVWSCVNHESNSHAENLWVFGRRRRLSPWIQDIVADNIRNFGLTHLKLQSPPQKGCK